MDLEERYLEFFYCLYKGILKDNDFLSGKKKKDYYTEAIECYRYDPLFHRAYNLNKQIMKELLKFEI